MSPDAPLHADALATLRADALATLRAWVPAAAPEGSHQDAWQERQLGSRDRFVQLLETRPDALRRSCFPDHLTAGVIVLSDDLTQVLLNLHRKAGRWFAFGGHCEEGDTSLQEAARREGLEESGLSRLTLDPVPVHLDEHAVDFCDPRGTVHHLDVRFAARVAADAEHRVSPESLDVRWWPVDALPEGLDDDMHDLVRVARTRLTRTRLTRTR